MESKIEATAIGGQASKVSPTHGKWVKLEKHLQIPCSSFELFHRSLAEVIMHIEYLKPKNKGRSC